MADRISAHWAVIRPQVQTGMNTMKHNVESSSATGS